MPANFYFIKTACAQRNFCPLTPHTQSFSPLNFFIAIGRFAEGAYPSTAPAFRRELSFLCVSIRRKFLLTPLFPPLSFSVASSQRFLARQEFLNPCPEVLCSFASRYNGKLFYTPRALSPLAGACGVFLCPRRRVLLRRFINPARNEFFTLTSPFRAAEKFL